MQKSRLTAVIEKLEAGDTVTRDDVQRVAALQALDIAVAGREFMEETARREAEHTQKFREFTEQP